MAVDNQTLVKNSMDDVFNKGDASAIASYFAGDLLDVVAQGIKDSRTAFPDLQYEITTIANQDDSVAFTYTAKGTQKGDFEGLPATNQAAQWTGSVIATITDGKITSLFVNEDQISKLTQLGHIGTLVNKSMTGHWLGSAHGINVDLTLTQNGTAITGTCTVSGFSGTHAVTGTNDYPNVTLRADLGNGLVATFTGAFDGPNAVVGHLTVLGSSLAVTINRQ